MCKCGATIFADSPRGFCSVCLFRTGLGSLDENDRREEPSRIQMEFGDYALLEEIGRGRPGRCLSRPSEKPEPYCRAQTTWPGSLDHRNAPETIPPRGRSCG